MRIKLFTHTDLDGVGCAVLAKIAYKNADITYADYDQINQLVKDYLPHAGEYDITYITDISVNQEVADMIDKSPAVIRLFDHHKTAMWLSKYSWATVYEGSECGTSIFYGHLCTYTDIKSYGCDVLVENIRQYDLWLWKENNNIVSRRLNTMLNILGRDKFVHRFSTNHYFFSANEIELIKIEEDRIEEYIQKAIGSARIKDVRINGKQYRIAVVFAEKEISEIGNRICLSNDDIDFAVIINLQGCGVSYRAVKDIDLGKDIAALYGGGGHPKAAGSEIGEQRIDKIIDLIMTTKE